MVWGGINIDIGKSHLLLSLNCSDIHFQKDGKKIRERGWYSIGWATIIS